MSDMTMVCKECHRHLPDAKGGYVFSKGWWYCYNHAPAQRRLRRALAAGKQVVRKRGPSWYVFGPNHVPKARASFADAIATANLFLGSAPQE